MDSVFDRVLESGQVPTRQDIADLLASIATPGQMRDEKEAAVLRLFQEAGHSPQNTWGHSVVSTLDSYEAF